jgi:hypothetical protein
MEAYATARKYLKDWFDVDEGEALGALADLLTGERAAERARCVKVLEDLGWEALAQRLED